MRISSLTIKYILLLIAQILLGNFFNFSQFIMISVLPVMVLMLPIRRSTAFCLVIAFIMGTAVDFSADGHLGLTAAALLPVAALRRPVIMFVFGNELFSREEDISPQRQGWEKILLATAICTAIFLAFFIIIDSAGTRAAWIDLIKFILSTILSTAVSMSVGNLIGSESEAKWK